MFNVGTQRFVFRWSLVGATRDIEIGCKEEKRGENDHNQFTADSIIVANAIVNSWVKTHERVCGRGVEFGFGAGYA